MSTQETEQGQQVEARSSVKISLNAKGEIQAEVKVRVGDTSEEVGEARRLAEINFDLLRSKYPRS